MSIMTDIKKPIYVTRPHLPPPSEFIPLLQEIWDSRVLTNGGPFHARLEATLAEYLGVPQVALFSNGRLALVVGPARPREQRRASPRRTELTLLGLEGGFLLAVIVVLVRLQRGRTAATGHAPSHG